MDEKKAEQNDNTENEVNEDHPTTQDGQSNNPLLWAITILLAVLVVLVSGLIMFNMNKEKQIQKQPTEELDVKPKPLTQPPAIEKPENKPSSDLNTVPKKPLVTPQAEEPKPEDCKAKKFDGKKYDDGESYTTLDGCETCTCNDGNWNCQVKPSCIILPSDCTHDNTIYHEGDARSADCDQTCTCSDGNWDCVIPPSSSCCKSDGKIYHSGESFPASDGCNTCSCNNGHASCTMMLCL